MPEDNKRLERIEKDIEELKKNDKETLKSMTEMEKSNITTGANIEKIFKSLKELKIDTKEIKDKPAKNYETIKWIIFGIFASNIVGIFIGIIMKKQ